MIQAVVIDVDDTLCLTETACFELENEALKRMGRSEMEPAVHLNTWGQPLFNAIATRSPGIDVREFRKNYQLLIEEFIGGFKLDNIPKVNYEALDCLVSLGKKLMLLTSRTHAEFKHLLAPDHQLSSRITAFYYQDNMTYHKPDPRAFDELLNDNSLEPERCVYVGDSPSDAVAATKAGLSFIASLESGIRQRQDFNGYKVASFIYKFPDIVEAVMALENS